MLFRAKIDNSGGPPASNCKLSEQIVELCELFNTQMQNQDSDFEIRTKQVHTRNGPVAAL